MKCLLHLLWNIYIICGLNRSLFMKVNFTVGVNDLLWALFLIIL